MSYIIKALSQPSTYAGLSGIALALGVSGEIYAQASAALAAVFGLVAVLVHERGAR